MDWYEVKEWIAAATGLGMDALHVHGGVFLQLGAALVLRRRLTSPIPWLLVLAAALVNEWHDYYYEIWEDRAGQRAESVRDIWNTMLLPTVLLLLARFLPWMFRAPPAEAPTEAEASAADPG